MCPTRPILAKPATGTVRSSQRRAGCTGGRQAGRWATQTPTGRDRIAAPNSTAQVATEAQLAARLDYVPLNFLGFEATMTERLMTEKCPSESGRRAFFLSTISWTFRSSVLVQPPVCKPRKGELREPGLRRIVRAQLPAGNHAHDHRFGLLKMARLSIVAVTWCYRSQSNSASLGLPPCVPDRLVPIRSQSRR